MKGGEWEIFLHFKNEKRSSITSTSKHFSVPTLSVGNPRPLPLPGNMVVWNLWAAAEESGQGAKSPAHTLPPLHYVTISQVYQFSPQACWKKHRAWEGRAKAVVPKSLWEGTHQTSSLWARGPAQHNAPGKGGIHRQYLGSIQHLLNMDSAKMGPGIASNLRVLIRLTK